MPAANFSRRALLSSAAIVPFAAIRGSAANDAISVGLIGAGNRGPYVASAMAKNTTARITAICDILPDKMEKAKKTIGVDNPKLYTDLHKLLASDVDAVIIATPVFLHADHFDAAVKSGKHIYIEKPASMDVAGCKRIIKTADSANRKLNITFGFQRRSGALYVKGKQLVDSGAIGAIRLAHAHFIKSAGGWNAGETQLPRPVTEAEKSAAWGSWQHLSGDLIVENNVHSIDVLNWFVGNHPLSAIGSGGALLPKKGDTRDHNFVAFEYPKGVQGQLSGTTLAPPGYRDVVEQFYGATGMIETSENHLKTYLGPGKQSFEKTQRNNTVDHVAEFVRRVAENKPENTAIRGAESTLTAILGRIAMERRREVTWDEMWNS